MSENVTNEENKKTVGFKVSAHEYNVLEQYAQIFHNQMVQDSDKGTTLAIENPKCVLCIAHMYFWYKKFNPEGFANYWHH